MPALKQDSTYLTLAVSALDLSKPMTVNTASYN